MSIDQLPSGTYRARLRLTGRTCSATFTTLEEAEEWEILTRARTIQGTLPSRTTVAQYATRWIAGHANAPANTRSFHQVNLDHWILPHLGRRPAASVTATDITMLMNQITDAVSASRADRVYRTLSAMFGGAGEHAGEHHVERTRSKEQPTRALVSDTTPADAHWGRGHPPSTGTLRKADRRVATAPRTPPPTTASPTVVKPRAMRRGRREGSPSSGDLPRSAWPWSSDRKRQGGHTTSTSLPLIAYAGTAPSSSPP